MNTIVPQHSLLTQGRKSIRPEDLKAYGVERFLQEQEALGPLYLPPVFFTEEENQLLDEILAAERTPPADAA